METRRLYEDSDHHLDIAINVLPQKIPAAKVTETSMILIHSKYCFLSVCSIICFLSMKNIRYRAGLHRELYEAVECKSLASWPLELQRTRDSTRKPCEAVEMKWKISD